MTRRVITQPVAMPDWAPCHAAPRHPYASTIVRLFGPILSPAATSQHRPAPSHPDPPSTRSPENDRTLIGLRLRSNPQGPIH